MLTLSCIYNLITVTLYNTVVDNLWGTVSSTFYGKYVPVPQYQVPNCFFVFFKRLLRYSAYKSSGDSWQFLEDVWIDSLPLLPKIEVNRFRNILSYIGRF